jgi:hypothetical protein
MAKAPEPKQRTKRADGRKSLLVYINPEVIRELKKRALDEGRTAYEITEEALSEWLASHRPGRRNKTD